MRIKFRACGFTLLSVILLSSIACSPIQTIDESPPKPKDLDEKNSTSKGTPTEKKIEVPKMVKIDDSGRRSVQVETTVPGDVDTVWKAVATPEGISAWFVPTTAEYDADGKPVKVIANFGPGMESISQVTEWSPPKRLGATSQDLGLDAPVIDTVWEVEPSEKGKCLVRVSHSLVSDSVQYDKSLEAWAKGWPDFFRILNLYLIHFPGQKSSLIQLTGFSSAPRSELWPSLKQELGFGEPEVGESIQTSGDVPSLTGVVERIGQDPNPEELLLRLSSPSSGLAHIFCLPMGEQILVSIRIILYGEEASQLKELEESKWQDWIKSHYPPAQQ